MRYEVPFVPDAAYTAFLAENTASLKLHERFGFVKVGLLPGVAWRYGKWSDSVLVQRSLGAGSTLPIASPGAGSS